MTILVPMRPESYDGYIQLAEADYANDIVAAGMYSNEQAREKARADFMATSPQGFSTPDNYFFEIMDAEQGKEIGFLWFCIREQYDVRTAFVCVIDIHAEWRRQGHATRAFEELESMVNALGVSYIEFHVFGHNARARALYAKLGYGSTSIYMGKRIEGAILE